jgi:hypothetical protein
MTATLNDLNDFEFPQAKTRDLFLVGMYPATLVEITKPELGKPNDSGDRYLTSIFKWRIDGYEEDLKYSWVNVEAFGEKSNWYKVVLALTGQKLSRTAPPRPADLVGKRCNLILEERTDAPGSCRVSGYARLVAAPPRRAAAPPPPPEDLEDVPFD